MILIDFDRIAFQVQLEDAGDRILSKTMHAWKGTGCSLNASIEINLGYRRRWASTVRKGGSRRRSLLHRPAPGPGKLTLCRLTTCSGLRGRSTSHPGGRLAASDGQWAGKRLQGTITSRSRGEPTWPKIGARMPTLRMVDGGPRTKITVLCGKRLEFENFSNLTNFDVSNVD